MQFLIPVYVSEALFFFIFFLFALRLQSTWKNDLILKKESIFISDRNNKSNGEKMIEKGAGNGAP